MVGFAGGVGGGNLGVNRYAADNALIGYSDCVAPAFSGGVASFTRPLTDVSNPTQWQYAMPGARMRFRSNALVVNALLQFTSQIAYTLSNGAIYINGAYFGPFFAPRAAGVATSHRVNIVNASAADRLYEIVLPHDQSISFAGVEVDAPYVVTAAAARTGTKYAILGNSIVQGFYATEYRNSWAFLLANAKSGQVINIGYGSYISQASDGTAAAALNPGALLVFTGTVEFNAQVALATFSATLTSLLTNFHTALPTVPIYVISPTYEGNPGTIPVSSYRTTMSNVVTSLGWAQLHYIDGTTLATNSVASFPDMRHPNDIGSSQMSAALAALVA